MAQLATINPELGIYAITYIDTQYNPDTKIVEGTTGKKYASTYMGARSRWWDLSMAQAQLEAKGVAGHNKRVYGLRLRLDQEPVQQLDLRIDM